MFSIRNTAHDSKFYIQWATQSLDGYQYILVKARSIVEASTLYIGELFWSYLERMLSSCLWYKNNVVVNILDSDIVESEFKRQ